jgi:hypothetical protein
VFHVCTSFCRIVYACFSFLRSFNFLMAIVRFVNVFVYVFGVLGAAVATAAALATAAAAAEVAARLLLLLREREEIGGIVT